MMKRRNNWFGNWILKRAVSLFLLSLLGGSIDLSGQSLDSLKQNLQEAKNDYQYFQSLLALSAAQLYRDADSALPYIEAAEAYAQAKGRPRWAVEAANQRGNYLQRRSQNEDALEVYAEAIERARNLGYDTGLAKLYNNIALIHLQQGDLPLALEEFVSATRYEEEIGNLSGKAQGLNNIGVVHYYQGDIEKSLDYFQQSVAIHELAGNELNVKQGYNNLGAIEEARENWPEALRFYEKSLAIARKLGDQGEMAQGLNNVAGVYLAMGNYASAETGYREAAQLNRCNRDYYSLALNYFNLCDLFGRQGQDDQCRQFFAQADSLIKAQGYKKLAYELYDLMSKQKAQEGAYSEAYALRLRFEAARDSVFNEEKAAALAEVQTRYETEQKERELAENKAALIAEQLRGKQRSLWILALILLLILFSGLGFFVYLQQKQKQKRLRAEGELKEKLAQYELRNRLEQERLRISRDLHDHIGAQLTIVSSQVDHLVYKEKNQRKRDQLERITDQTRDTMAQLRETIWALNNQAVNLQMFAGKLREFCQRFASRERQVWVDLPPEMEDWPLGPNQTIQLFRACQEGIQNAYKYAEFRLLELRFFQAGDQLCLEIRDDGQGFELGEAQSSGYGLQNMRARIRELGGEFTLESKPGRGTRILFQMPLAAAS